MKQKLLTILIIFSLALASCQKDNKEAPTATITGKVVFNKEPVGVRSNGVQLELWQQGYQLFSKIPVYVQQDGSFSAKVYDGKYKLTLLKGNGPWADKTDTIDVVVKGSATVDVPVDPYFLIKSETFQKSGNNIDASFSLQSVNMDKGLELVRLYIGQTNITDQNNNAAIVTKVATDITDLRQPINLSAAIPAALSNKDYVFVRIGVKALGVGELVYSQPQMIRLK